MIERILVKPEFLITTEYFMIRILDT